MEKEESQEQLTSDELQEQLKVKKKEIAGLDRKIAELEKKNQELTDKNEQLSKEVDSFQRFGDTVPKSLYEQALELRELQTKVGLQREALEQAADKDIPSSLVLSLLGDDLGSSIKKLTDYLEERDTELRRAWEKERAAEYKKPRSGLQSSIPRNWGELLQLSDDEIKKLGPEITNEILNKEVGNG